MTNIARALLALSVVALLSLIPTTPAQAHLVQDFGIRKGKVADISLSTGFDGFIGAGIKKIKVDGIRMDAFCIDPFTMARRSSSGYEFVPLTQAPESPWTLSAREATQISDLWAMFYSPNMTKKKAAGLQLAIWEIVGGDDFTIVGKKYGAGRMLAALRHYHGPGADLTALTGPGQDYVVQTPPHHAPEGTPTPTAAPVHTPTPRPTTTPTPTPGPSGTPVPTPTPEPTRPPPTPNPTPPPHNVPDSGSTFYLLACAILALLAINKFRTPLPAVARVRTKR